MIEQMSHAFVGVLTCAKIHSIELDRMSAHWNDSTSFFFLTIIQFFLADEGGATVMSGGIPWLTLPAGYLGSSFIGACLITCGFNTNASKVASIVLAVFFLFTLWWARKNWLYVCSLCDIDSLQVCQKLIAKTHHVEHGSLFLEWLV